MRFVAGTVATLIVGAAAVATAEDNDPLALAEEAYQKASYHQARDLARRGLSAQPVRAWRLIGASSCLLKDRSAALEALGHLTAKADGELVRFACQKNAIEISDEDALMAGSPARASVDRAQAAYAAGKYPEAKKLALEATVADPKLARGWRLLGAASCWTRDKVTAQKSSEHLQPVDQEFIRTLCSRTLGAQLKSSRTVR